MVNSKSTDKLKILCDTIPKIDPNMLLKIKSVTLKWVSYKDEWGYDAGVNTLCPQIEITFK